MLNVICGDCLEVLKTLDKDSIDVVLTSPPYNTSRNVTGERAMKNHEARYDIYLDTKTEEEYIQWICDIFMEFDKVLKENGTILWNVSYTSDNQGTSMNTLWRCIAKILDNTPFMVADKIVWKKGCALPNNVSSNKLTRICEDVFVFCRKDEYATFKMNKEVSSIGKNGQKYYKTYFNFVEARNNDGSNKLNKATYSTELCTKLLKQYALEGATVLDPFSGTGTTLNACKELNLNGIGIELSKAQCDFAMERLGLNV